MTQTYILVLHFYKYLPERESKPEIPQCQPALQAENDILR